MNTQKQNNKPPDFAVFILTYGRPDRQYTYESIRKAGYDGPVYFVVSTDDSTIPEMQKRFGADRVFIFDKAEVAKRMDLGDNFSELRAVVFARNAAFEIAKKLGIKYMLTLDDDYDGWVFRMNSHYDYITKNTKIKKSLGRIFGAFLDYYKSIDAKSIAMAQGGDFVGGSNGGLVKDGFKAKRKAMNTFFCNSDKPFTFQGRINEDVNTVLSEGARGGLFLTISFVSVNQKETQSNPGGMTGLYTDLGTYVKSFYSVIFAPSCVSIMPMGNTHKRLHHHVNWDKAVPKIVGERWRK